jgi:hypothetical protein
VPPETLTQTLARPVEFGEIRLAPTTELVGLAELTEATDDESRLATLLRVAESIRVEDAERRRIRELRAAAERDALGNLPRRR